MQDLPEELQEEILLSLKEPKDLQRACSTSLNQRRICSSASFWREKFRRENLPLVEEGNNFAEWSEIYRKSLRAAKRTDERILSGELIRINLASVDDPEILQPLGNTEEIVRYWNIMQTFTNVERDAIRLTKHYYDIDFFPSPKVSRYELVDNSIIEPVGYAGVRGEMLGGYTRVKKLKILDGTVSTEDLWFILYQTTYSSLLNFSEQHTNLLRSAYSTENV
ncbi:F-box domain-containing protein [Cedratvirus Zaza IHUMI]|uniref:F-box domain-containing protein n=1 Tax=Cedratvirus Zaza IHUMI TaxID=2126979 RepID=A0A2R8FEB8_9VIRU|nr:F-box domain-containing protein [Cedratvirus Zaza IHUMI]